MTIASKRQQMSIPGDDDACFGRDGAFQNAIVLGVVLDGVDSLSRIDEIGQSLDFGNQGMDYSLRILELLAPEDTLDLIQNSV